MSYLIRNKLFVFCSVISTTLTFANILEHEKTYLESEQKTLITETRKTSEELKAIASALRAIAAPQKSMTTLLANDAQDEIRSRQRKILEASLLRALKRQEQLQKQETETKAQLHLLDLAFKHTKTPAPTQKKNSLQCDTWPLRLQKPTPLIRDFGPAKDSDTNLTWQHSGWLLDSSQTDVVSCSKGRVLFSGIIPGRDHVVIIEHDGGHLGTYAHLDPSRLPSMLKRGAFVKSGDSLGTSLNRFYFEIRQFGVAIDPRQVFNKKLVTGRLSDLSI